MKGIWLLLLSLMIIPAAQAQITDMQAAKMAAFNAAKTMDEALINKQYADYVSYNHPKVLEKVEGGADGLAVQIAKQVADIEANNNIITAIWPNMPTTMIDSAGEWQCTMPQFMEYRLPEGKIKAETTLIGLSPDKGKTWYFIDAAGRTLAQLQELFPNLSSKLVIAEPKEAQFTPDTTKK